MRIYVNAVGLRGPGLAGWAAAQATLSGRTPYRAEMPVHLPDLPLPRNAARRATFMIRLALHVAREALDNAGTAGLAATAVRSVFACAGGDTEALDKVFAALTLPERPVSPTQFSNTVHNAPAGYWSIAAGSHEPTLSIGAYDGSFAAGLLAAASLVAAERQSALLVAYDAPPPAPLQPFRTVQQAFGVALLLTPEQQAGGGQAQLELQFSRAQQEQSLADPHLEALRLANPAARSLPLLKAFAERARGQLVLPYCADSQLSVRYEYCDR